jgi:hypothetical protein
VVVGAMMCASLSVLEKAMLRRMRRYLGRERCMSQHFGIWRSFESLESMKRAYMRGMHGMIQWLVGVMRIVIRRSLGA